jgi:excisionase family DNA binding protein
MPAVITAEQAAEKLGVSLRRMQALLKQRRIPGARLVGGRIWQVPDNFTVTPGKRGPKLRS